MAADRLAELSARLDRLESGFGDTSDICTAQNPHQTMRWDRMQYWCSCGKQYMKDGRGGLREV